MAVPSLFAAQIGLTYRIGSGAMHQERCRPFFTINVGLGLNEEAQVEYFLAPDDTCPWNAIGTAIIVSEDTQSDGSFKLAKDWLDTCTKEHTLCNRISPTRLPTRVVDLGRQGDGAVPEIRLYESQNEVQRYMCLSHCWGKYVSITTTTKTLAERKAGIPWSSLSKTFQEAITICRKFGVRYIWIDSLCIIQDSREDWEREAAKMAPYYQGAYLTIAASKSADGGQGCFAAPSAENATAELSGRTSEGELYSIHVRRVLPHWNHLRSHFSSFPLLTRGWVYQERLLSPRILHFGPRELIWECTEQTICECFGTHQQGIYTHPKLTHSGALLDASPTTAVNLFWRWRQMVMEYTSLDLTRVSDLLPALGGIALDMGRFRHVRYLAGLWEDSLVGDMCWSTWAYYAHNIAATERQLACRKGDPSAEEWRAPSWSWASCNAEIEYSDVVDFTDDAKVEDLVVVPRPATIFFGLELGFIKLEGWMTTATLSHFVRPMPPHGEWTRVFDIDRFGREERRKGPGCYFLPDFDLIARGNGRLNTSGVVYCMRMGMTESRVYSIVLDCHEKDGGWFRRIGLLTQTRKIRGYVDLYDGLKEKSVLLLC